MNAQLFQDRLLDWYACHKRDLTFRHSKDAYQIWISEIMAQQTRIEAMLPYFERFVRELPDIRHLSRVSDRRLNKLWQGLGYYSRAANLKKCAQVCMEEYGGQLPQTKEQLMKLPGIGPYTAGAIASIAFGQRVSAVDGNVIRVFSRLRDDHHDMTKAAHKRRLEEAVISCLPDRERVGDFNQALMELGALICLPQNPKCTQCPVKTFCLAKHPETLPVMPKKKERRKEKKTIYLLVYEDRIHLQKRGKNTLLAGLYEFGETCPAAYQKIEHLQTYTHVFSHVEWEMDAYMVWVFEKDDTFYSLEQIHSRFAIPSAFQPFLKQAERRLYEKTGD
ncbi:MAG: A/G-specific adenine glycosylase [Erysipelotrichaceae bacterium]|nr:A/G-specific adenine glycosylase [Erysipelotrichaceae bacterium]